MSKATGDFLDTILNGKPLSEELKQIWREVKQNHAKLDSCAGPHEFLPEDIAKRFGGKYRCIKCRGTIDAVNYLWYTRGLEHGRK